MSFIGPRPSPLGNEKLYSKEYLKKFKVKPGISGFSQVYFRNAATLAQRQKSDLYYVENFSFILDMKIFFKTFFIVLRKKGIYTNKR